MSAPAPECRFRPESSSGRMPLWKGQPYSPSQPALNVSSDVDVLVVRFTGELFTSYECVPPVSNSWNGLNSYSKLIPCWFWGFSCPPGRTIGSSRSCSVLEYVDFWNNPHVPALFVHTCPAEWAIITPNGVGMSIVQGILQETVIISEEGLDLPADWESWPHLRGSPCQ